MFARLRQKPTYQVLIIVSEQRPAYCISAASIKSGREVEVELQGKRQSCDVQIS
jgi:hypothetical protein